MARRALNSPKRRFPARAVTEVAAPVLTVWPGEGALPAQLRLLGVLGCVGTHHFIVSHVPLGSLMEWNSFNLLATVLVHPAMGCSAILLRAALSHPGLSV